LKRIFKQIHYADSRFLMRSGFPFSGGSFACEWLWPTCKTIQSDIRAGVLKLTTCD
jgi:hypothetical protein